MAQHHSKPLTTRQAEVLLLLQAYEDEHGGTPSFAQAAKLANATDVRPILEALADKGLITVAGGIRILKRIPKVAT